MPNEELQKEYIQALKRGISNLLKHIDNLKNKFGMQTIVAINKYNHDTEKEINFLQEKLNSNNIQMSLVESWGKGSEGAVDLAKKVVNLCDEGKSNFSNIYNLEEKIEEKIEKICKKIYGAEKVILSEEAQNSIKMIENLGYSNLPICIAKTQYSFSDDPKNLECKAPFSINVKDINLKAGAEFIVVMAGNIMTMPGLPKVPASENMKINEDGKISGIF